MAVDDEPGILRLLKTHLESWGCEVIGVVDSRQALERLKEEKVDGLFVDVMMPHVDGFYVTQQVRLLKLNGRIPIVMLTARDDAETMRKCFAAGASFFLGKPFTRERVYKLLGGTRAAMLREQQRYVRLPYSTKVDCIWGIESKHRFSSVSVNISEGGMKFAPSVGLTVGQEIEVSFQLPGMSRFIKTRAMVVREAPPNAVGIQFVKLNALDEKDLQAYIQARLE
jgi:CheY-like chemotaxis protein